MTTAVTIPAWLACLVILFATFGAYAVLFLLQQAIESFREFMAARRDYYRLEAKKMTSPADPPPEPAPVGSPEGADRLRAAMDDHDADTREEN